MDLGTRIRLWRAARRLTQTELAEKVGVCTAAVSYWERNVTSPTQRNLDALVEAFGVTMSRFYGGPPAKRVAA